MKFNHQVLIKAGLLAAVIVVSFPACKKDKGSAVVMPPQYPQNSCYIFGSTVVGQQALDCCQKDASGVYVPKAVASQPQGRCPSAPGISAIRTAVNSFGEASVVGRSAIAAAKSMERKAQVHKNVSAATAGGMQVASKGPKPLDSADEGAFQQLAGDSAGDGSTARGGGGAGGGGGGGGVASLSMDSVTTAAAPKGANGPSMPGLQEGAETGAYEGGSGGAGGAGGRGGAVDWDAMAGRGLGGDGKGGSGTMDLSRTTASGDPMGSADPSDYFSMLRPGDSIFKIVERRYTTKAQSWALTDAKGAARSVTPAAVAPVKKSQK
ncbi:MAG: hypothetical protein NDJ90_09290 [Oligoflexia bacterium]|nr:hypothetical protein [Oligoflexia bacterium]